MGKSLYWLGVMKNLGNEAVSKKDTRQNFPLVIGKNVAISIHFLSSTAFLIIFIKKEASLKMSKKTSATPFLIALYHIIILLARRKLVRQSL